MKNLIDGISSLYPWEAIGGAVLRIALILVLAWLLLFAAKKAIKLFQQAMGGQTRDLEDRKRLQTLSQVFRYIASVTITVLAVMLVLNEVGISIAPILATAGVVGLAVGFGAQSLVKDYFTGFFLLLENQVRQGDVVEVGGKAGLVEEVTLRYIRLRDYDGDVHFVPNGVINTVTNKSRGFSFAVVEVGVGYSENLDEIFSRMREVGAEMQADDVFGQKILEPIDIAGVEKWADSAVLVRGRFKTLPLEQWNVKREFLRRLKSNFERNKIDIPYPHMTVVSPRKKEDSATLSKTKTGAALSENDR